MSILSITIFIFDIFTYFFYMKKLFNACYNFIIIVSILNFQGLFLQQLATFQKTKQLYNHHQNVSMSILSITIFVFFDLLIQVCQNCPIYFKLDMMIHNTVRYIQCRKHSNSKIFVNIRLIICFLELCLSFYVYQEEVGQKLRAKYGEFEDLHDNLGKSYFIQALR